MSTNQLRTIAIGDVHGCANALRDVLTQIQPRAEDTIIFLGDYIDRGPDTKSVIDQIKQLQDVCSVITLRGNHEEMVLAALNDFQEESFWKRNGGDKVLGAYGVTTVFQLPKDFVEFVRSTTWYYETDKYFFCHGYYEPDRPLFQTHWNEVCWIHVRQGSTRSHCSGKIAIVGHTPQRDRRILDLTHLKCIDTGSCFSGGCLTALDVETGQIWQADEYEIR